MCLLMSSIILFCIVFYPNTIIIWYIIRNKAKLTYIVRGLCILVGLLSATQQPPTQQHSSFTGITTTPGCNMKNGTMTRDPNVYTLTNMYTLTTTAGLAYHRSIQGCQVVMIQQVKKPHYNHKKANYKINSIHKDTFQTPITYRLHSNF